MNNGGLDMGTPVYVAAYPDYVFYHRYDPRCDCIRIVRLVEFGGTRYWVDHTGRRIREGYWEPARPSPHALHDYREWSHQHRTEFHHAQPPRRVEPPAPRPPQGSPPAPRPFVTPPAAGPVVAPAAPQPLVGPDGKRERHRDGENGAGIRRVEPTPKADVAKPEDKAFTPDPRHRRRDGGKDLPPKPAPAPKPADIKPAPTPTPAPAPKLREKPADKDDHEHQHADKPEGAQK